MQERDGKSETGPGSHNGKIYRVISVEPIDPPAGVSGRWYAYVLEDGNSVIHGQRNGTRAQVTEHAQAFAGELNARSRNGYRTSWSPRGGQKKA